MNNLLELDKKAMLELSDIFHKIDDVCYFNSNKVLSAFQKEQVSMEDFSSTTGYGYNDMGRDKLERIYADIFKCEDALVRNQFVSGSHALCVTYFALLRPGDKLLSITGKPYDTMDEVIGITPNNSSLKSFGIHYDQIDLINDDFDIVQIQKYLANIKVKVILIQRSRGYSTRKSLTISKVEQVIKAIREVSQDVIIMVDNCYCELVDRREPTEVGADIVVGSLIKNLGGGIAPNGAYVVGKSDLISLVADRLTLPGEGREVGPTLSINRSLYQGLFMAPSVVSSSLKTAVYTSYMLENLGYQVDPSYREERADIVESIIFKNKDKLVNYTKAIQKNSPVDSYVSVVPAPMPGYLDEVIMASGSFTQGSSIELSCDGPIREPYIAYQQGSLTFEYGHIAILNALKELIK